MNLFNPIANFFTRLVAPPSLDEIIAVQLETKYIVVLQAEHVIKTHRFQKHMAQAEIQAMIAWNSAETKSTGQLINTDDYRKSALKDASCQ